MILLWSLRTSADFSLKRSRTLLSPSSVRLIWASLHDYEKERKKICSSIYPTVYALTMAKVLMYHNIRVILSQCFRTPLTPLKQPRSRDSRPGYTYFLLIFSSHPHKCNFVWLYILSDTFSLPFTQVRRRWLTQTFSEEESFINA